MKPEKERPKKDWRPVARWIIPDVSSEIYEEELESLINFASNFNVGNRTHNLDELIAKIEDNSIAVETVIRAIGDSEKTDLDGEVYYTYFIKTDCFRASHLPEKGIIKVSIASDLGFDGEGMPLNGYELCLPDGSGSKEWLKPGRYQLIGYNKCGGSIKTVKVGDIGKVRDFRLMRDEYKEAILHIIKFADSRK